VLVGKRVRRNLEEEELKGKRRPFEQKTPY
jgi:hypothetical protein